MRADKADAAGRPDRLHDPFSPVGEIMVYRGHVHNGMVVIEDGADLRDGTLVTIEPVDDAKPASSADPVYRLGDLAAPTGIPDLALNIDHYLYGSPNVNDAGQ